MNVEYLDIYKLFSRGGDIHYVLPHFQREYTWGKDNWKTLLEDALAIYGERKGGVATGKRNFEHFLGSIVVIPDGNRAGTIPAFKLVDGQQRLTTIALLLKALETSCSATHPQLAKKIAKLVVNEDESGDLYFTILPTTKYGDRAAYADVICGRPSGAHTSKIPEAYDYFVRELKTALSTGLDPEQLYTVVRSSFQVVFIELHPNESPYKIFESLNAKGKPLSQADLVRNYVAMRLPSDDQERVFTKSWSRVENLLQESRLVGRLGELTAFLRHYLAMRLGVLVDEGHVYARFRDRAEAEFPDSASFETEIETISRFGEHYDRLLRPSGFQNREIANALERLNRLESATAYPFLLTVIDRHCNGQLDGQSLLDLLGTLENYMVRRYLAGESPNSLNKVFPLLWGQLDVDRLGKSLREALSTKNYPSDSVLLRKLEFRKLYAENASVRARTGLVLESLNRKLYEGTGGYAILDGAATIEHILPQTLSSRWKESLGDTWEQAHRDYVHTLGNLSLVTGEWNSELSNAPFERKREKLASHALRLNSDYFSQPFTRWGIEEIRTRTEYLGGRIVELWPEFPESIKVKPPDPDPVPFPEETVNLIAAKLQAPGLRRVSRRRFESLADGVRVVGLYSKRLIRAQGKILYWLGFSPAHREYLTWQGHSWVAFQCEAPNRVLLLEFSRFEPWLSGMNEGEGTHWHVTLYESEGRILLRLPVTKEQHDLTEQLIAPEPPPSSP